MRRSMEINAGYYNLAGLMRKKFLTTLREYTNNCLV